MCTSIAARTTRHVRALDLCITLCPAPRPRLRRQPGDHRGAVNRLTPTASRSGPRSGDRRVGSPARVPRPTRGRGARAVPPGDRAALPPSRSRRSEAWVACAPEPSPSPTTPDLLRCSAGDKNHSGHAIKLGGFSRALTVDKAGVKPWIRQFPACDRQVSSATERPRRRGRLRPLVAGREPSEGVRRSRILEVRRGPRGRRLLLRRPAGAVRSRPAAA